MAPTTRQFKQGGREWFVVEGDAGAITFFAYRRGKKREPGDLGYHEAAEGPRAPQFEDDTDPFWHTGCEFTQTKGCRYSGYTAYGMLDLLTSEGPVVLLDHLTDIYEKHFSKGA